MFIELMLSFLFEPMGFQATIKEGERASTVELFHQKIPRRLQKY